MTFVATDACWAIVADVCMCRSLNEGKESLVQTYSPKFELQKLAEFNWKPEKMSVKEYIIVIRLFL